MEAYKPGPESEDEPTQTSEQSFDEKDWPDELLAAEQEATAFITQAKKQRAKVEQAGGFLRSLQTPRPDKII